jgi:hypothetical protein
MHPITNQLNQFVTNQMKYYFIRVLNERALFEYKKGRGISKSIFSMNQRVFHFRSPGNLTPRMLRKYMAPLKRPFLTKLTIF